jgi:hypothetical protein
MDFHGVVRHYNILNHITFVIISVVILAVCIVIFIVIIFVIFIKIFSAAPVVAAAANPTVTGIVFLVVVVLCFILSFRMRVVDRVVPRPVPRDHTHPLYHEKICHMFRDHNVLLKGLDQGKTLTKTVEVKTGLPLELENLVGALHLPGQDMLVQR